MGDKMQFCSLYSGSSGNSIYVSSPKSKILVDAGVTGKSVVSALESINVNPVYLDGILVTHEHSDHIKGVGILSRRFNLPIYANEKTWASMKNKIGKLKNENINIIDKHFSINDMEIETFKVPHDATDAIGYSIYSAGKKISIATDMGIFTDEIKKNIKDSDLVLIESNHDEEMLKFGPYPYDLKRRILSSLGHLSNSDSGSAILEILKYGPKKIILGHLSGTNNVPELAYKTVENILFYEKVKIGTGQDVELSIASRTEPSKLIEL